MFKKILVPLDGSPLAEGVLPLVIDLARVHGAEVMLLRVAFYHTLPGLDVQEHEARAVEEAQAYLDGVASGFQEQGLTVSTHVRYGQPCQEILRHAERHAELVVMATHGLGGMLRWAMGSVADRVVRRSPVPVLLIRSQDGNTSK